MPKIIQAGWQGNSAELMTRFHAKRNIQSLITDPPFGVDNQSNSAVTPEGKKNARKIENDESPEIAMQTFTEVMAASMPGMRNESDIYVFTSWQVLHLWIPFTRETFEPHGYAHKAILVWEKDGPGQGDLNSWGMGCEYVLYFKRGSRVPTAKRRNCILHYPQIRPKDLLHPHEKPPSMLIDFMRYSVDPGGLAVDPFGGSLSLARAARKDGRNSAVSIELNEENFEIGHRSLEQGEGSGLFDE